MAPLVRTGGSRHTGLAALPHRNIQNTNLEVAKKLTGILQVQSATESIANYTSNQHTAIYHRTVEEK